MSQTDDVNKEDEGIIGWHCFPIFPFIMAECRSCPELFISLLMAVQHLRWHLISDEASIDIKCWREGVKWTSIAGGGGGMWMCMTRRRHGNMEMKGITQLSFCWNNWLTVFALDKSPDANWIIRSQWTLHANYLFGGSGCQSNLLPAGKAIECWCFEGIVLLSVWQSGRELRLSFRWEKETSPMTGFQRFPCNPTLRWEPLSLTSWLKTHLDFFAAPGSCFRRTRTSFEE